MQSFEIEDIYGDGYERWAKIKNLESEGMFYAHFIEYDEYLENTRVFRKRKKGDILNVYFKIDLVTQYRVINDNENRFIQPINQCSNITAIGTVKKIKDSDVIICSIRGLGDNIVVEFEDDIEIDIDTNIEINGSLELELE